MRPINEDEEMEEEEEQKDKIQEYVSIYCKNYFSMKEVGKVPMPSKMYTKNVDVNQSHKFGHQAASKPGVCYDPLPWTDFFDTKEKLNDLVPLYTAGHEGHVFLCMHGAGHSALSFSSLAKHLKNNSTIVAFDFRGHGDNQTENETDLSEETLVNDSIEVIRHVCQKFSEASVMIVGHSMGGSIATKATSKILKDHSTE